LHEFRKEHEAKINSCTDEYAWLDTSAILENNNFDLNHQTTLAMTSWLCIVLTVGLVGSIILLSFFMYLLEACECHSVREGLRRISCKECFCKEAEWFFYVYTRYN
jgi:hypothetical protein